MSIKIAAAYVRVSTDDQLEYSPDSQIKTVRDAAKRDGYIIPDEYIYREEDGISGRSADKRPKFRLMIAQAKQDPAPFAAIYVWKYSRFARNQEEAILYKNLLRKRGIIVRSVSEPSFDDSPFASLIERIIEWMDEYYLINLATEVRRGMVEKATRGEPTGNPPYGYSVVDKHLVPNENAAIVRYVFEQYAAGVPVRSIAVDLAGKGIKTRRGNAPSNRWVSYMVGNPVYIGKIRYSSEGHANYDRANYRGDNVLIADGKHEPIISAELWNECQQRTNKRRAEPRYIRSDHDAFMLQGLIRCGTCGATLTRLATKTPSLQCHNYAKGLCHVSHAIAIYKAEDALISALESVLDSRTFVFAPRKAPESAPTHDWGKLIVAEKTRLKRAQDAYLDGTFTGAEYAAVKSEIQDTIEKLTAAQESEKKSAPEPDAETMTERVLNLIKVLKSPDVSPLAKNQALRSIIEKVLYIKEKQLFEIYFAPDL